MNNNEQTPSQNVDSKNILITNYRSQLFWKCVHIFSYKVVDIAVTVNGNSYRINILIRLHYLWCNQR